MTNTQIDTTSLLTILGVIAAVWALISPTNKLQLRFCMTWWDWGVGGIVLFLIHYLVFAPALQSVGLYYSLGSWKWGLDGGSAVYLLLLASALYFFWRTRFPALVRGRVGIFLELIENLNLTSRYDELVLLVEPQLSRLITLSKHRPMVVRLIDRIDKPQNNLAALLRGEVPKARSAWANRLSSVLQSLKSWSLAHAKDSTLSHEVLLSLVASPKLTKHLAIAHPYFCLKLLETEEAVHSDFIENYMDALLDVPASRLYVELKNNQNLNGGSRLYLPDNNRLLRFFFFDASAAMKNGMDKAIGEPVRRRLDEDKVLAAKLNEPIGSYYEVGKFRCPINSGISLFEIMVHEGIHQGLQDHMWLYYFGEFSKKILKQMPIPTDEESHQEWPTPFHYLLYRMIGVATDWMKQCSRIVDEDIPADTLNAEGFDRHFISKEAAKMLGMMLEDIIPSEKLSTSFKIYLLEVVVRCHIELQNDPKLKDVASSFLGATISGSDYPTSVPYRRELKDVFRKMDHVLKRNAATFAQALEALIV